MLKNKLRHFYYNFRARIKYFINKQYFFPELKIMNDKQTVEEILNGKSISRFGDGELSLIINNEAIGYQDADCSLNKALMAVLKKPSDNLIVCVPRGLVYRDDLTRKAKWFWVWYLSMYKEKICSLLNKEYEYGNTNFTRFYMDLKDKSKTKNKVKSLKKIWDRKKILIIEGEKTRLGVTNDLFDNATSVNRFIVPSKNAFRKYRLILEKAIKISKKYDPHLEPVGMVRSYEEALTEYKLALLCAAIRQVHDSEVGLLTLKIAWLYRAQKLALGDDTESFTKAVRLKYDGFLDAEEKYLKKAMDYLLKARQTEEPPIAGMNETAIDFLLASLCGHFGKFDDAARLVSGILQSKQSSPSQKDRARDMLDAFRDKRDNV